jgi:hypothetical protein
MKNNIFIPQYAFETFTPKISWRACIVLNYLSGWQLFSKVKTKKLIFENEEYLWINYATLIKDLPILRTKNKVLIGKIIDELVKYKLLKKKRTEDNTVYVRLTDFAVSLYNLPIQAIEATYTGLYRQPIQHNTITNNTITNNIVGDTPNTGKIEKPLEETPFNSEAYIESLKKNPQRHIQIIGLYWAFKHYKFENKKQAEKSLKREMPPASNLAPYSNAKISEVMDYLDEYADYKWTLETVFKHINDDIDDLIAKAEAREKQRHSSY